MDAGQLIVQLLNSRISFRLDNRKLTVEHCSFLKEKMGMDASDLEKIKAIIEAALAPLKNDVSGLEDSMGKLSRKVRDIEKDSLSTVDTRPPQPVVSTPVRMTTGSYSSSPSWQERRPCGAYGLK